MRGSDERLPSQPTHIHKILQGKD